MDRCDLDITELAEDFWHYVDIKTDDECWNWLKGTNGKGYGLFWFKRKQPLLAHRVAYEITSDKRIGDFVVCHACDNPSCCNPKHLFIGTQADNIHDAMLKGRLHGGRPKILGRPTKIDTTALGMKIAKEIRSLYAQGLSMTDIAKQTNRSISSVSRIVRNKRRCE